MSVSKWAYDPEKCDDTFCVGDCDYCELASVTEGRDIVVSLPEEEEEDDG